MRNWINEHLHNLLGYILAFLAPVGPLLIIMQMVVISDYFISKHLAKKKGKIEQLRKLHIILLVGLYVWIFLMLRVIEDFLMNGTALISNVYAGYVMWIHIKRLIQNIDEFAGTDMWNKIEAFINKIKV